MQQDQSPAGAGVLSRLGGRLGRETGVYASSSVATFFFGIVGVAVLTRLLELDEFGRLSLYLLFAAFLTVLYNLGTLQGTFMSVYGAGADDEGGDVEDGEADASDPGRALTTGLLITVLIAALGTCLVAAMADPLLTVLLGPDEGSTETLMLAGVVGAVGSVWRIAVNVLRFERRPWLFSTLNALRAGLVVAGSASLVALDHGIDGALIGTGGGTALATIVALAVSWRSYRLSLSRRAPAQIMRRGGFTVPYIAAIWVVHNMDLYLVSRYLSEDEVARYRVASRIGAGMSYFVSAFLLAWSPLRGTALFAAVERQGDPRSTVVTYFALVSLWITLALVVLADVLIRIAPSEYESAAPVIPLVALGFVAFGLFTLFNRLGRYPKKRLRFVQLAIAAAFIFIGSGFVLVPWLGVYGAALAQVVAFGLVAVVAFLLGERGGHPIALSPRRLLTAVAVTVACVGATRAIAAVTGDEGLVLELLVVGAFPLLLVAADVVPRNELRAVLSVLLGRRTRAARRPAFVAAMGNQSPLRISVIELLALERRSPSYAADVLSTTEDVVLSEAARALRALNGSAEDKDADAEIGSYLFVRRSGAERDRLARLLWKSGADPAEVETMESTLELLRRGARGGW